MKIAHILVRDNRKSDFTEKPRAIAFSIFIENYYQTLRGGGGGGGGRSGL